MRGLLELDMGLALGIAGLDASGLDAEGLAAGL